MPRLKQRRLPVDLSVIRWISLAAKSANGMLNQRFLCPFCGPLRSQRFLQSDDGVHIPIK